MCSCWKQAAETVASGAVPLLEHFGFVLLALWLALFGSGCDKCPTQVVAAKPSPAVGSTSMTPSPSNVAEAPLVVSGPLIVEHQVDIAAQRDGILTRIETEPGARVHRTAYFAKSMFQSRNIDSKALISKSLVQSA